MASSAGPPPPSTNEPATLDADALDADALDAAGLFAHGVDTLGGSRRPLSSDLDSNAPDLASFADPPDALPDPAEDLDTALTTLEDDDDEIEIDLDFDMESDEGEDEVATTVRMRDEDEVAFANQASMDGDPNHEDSGEEDPDGSKKKGFFGRMFRGKKES